MSPATRRGPTDVTVRMYKVGFGDCFLLSFSYASALPDGRAERHVLVDFGSSHTGTHGVPLPEVADHIAAHCGGRLDVVIATHRHKDHLQGYGTTASGEAIEALSPALVVQPWTEHPDLAHDATAPAVGDRSREFVATIAAGQEFAAAVGEAIGAVRGVRGDVRQLALDQVSNKAAVDRLTAWGQDGEAEYLSFGSTSRIEQVVPGVRVRVLGPPTVEQWPAILGQRSNDPEYWLSHRRMLVGALEASGLASETVTEAVANVAARGEVDPGPIRWLVARMQGQQLASLQRIVRTVDDALNNTSLILVFEVGDRRLLFPGDAQIENWSYPLREALAEKERAELLGEIDLYKVGHHGSRNATPRSLFALWGETPEDRRPLTVLMSTLGGVHGKSETTRVPRATLVEALRRRGTLHSTEEMEDEQAFVTVSASTKGDAAFEVVDDRP
ncbi:MAG: hypothetical protein M3323_01175 [Actinomycetota bacterium]|nr:hypothetical protein [Actinomycetota bacterium]